MKIIFRVLKFLSGFKLLLVASIVLNTLFSLLDAAAITIIQPILETLFANGNVESSSIIGEGDSWRNEFFAFLRNFTVADSQSETLFRLSIFIVLLFGIKNAVKFVGSAVNTRFGEGVVKKMRDTLFSRLTELSLDFHNKHKTGDLISLTTNDISVMHGSISPFIYTVFREPIQVAFFLALLLAYSPTLTLIAFGATIFSLAFVQFSRKFLRRYAIRMQETMAHFTSVLQEVLSNIRIVKLANAEPSVNKRFAEETRRYVRTAVKNEIVTSLTPAINETSAIAALAIVLYIGGMEVHNGLLRGEELMTFLFALFAIMRPVANLTSLPAQLQRGIVAAGRVFSVLDAAPGVRDGHLLNPKFSDAIEVSNLTFSYGSKNVLANVSFLVEKGKKIALVGSSGSGKSTMSDLIVRFYDPMSGGIFLDNVNIMEYNIAAYRSLFGVVSQDAALLNDTVANNIRLAKPDASMADVEHAAKIAFAHDFIMDLPEAYDTKVGDRGVLLSGGQRQRIAIARALLHRPEILIFDEATSALDSISEQAVQAAVNNVLKNQTAIIIAHRLSTIVNVDTIIVFEQGAIVESGSHEELLAKKGVYKHLYDVQFQDHSLKRESGNYER